jgi:hypothetical protein
MKTERGSSVDQNAGSRRRRGVRRDYAAMEEGNLGIFLWFVCGLGP